MVTMLSHTYLIGRTVPEVPDEPVLAPASLTLAPAEPVLTPDIEIPAEPVFIPEKNIRFFMILILTV